MTTAEDQMDPMHKPTCCGGGPGTKSFDESYIMEQDRLNYLISKQPQWVEETVQVPKCSPNRNRVPIANPTNPNVTPNPYPVTVYIKFAGAQGYYRFLTISTKIQHSNPTICNTNPNAYIFKYLLPPLLLYLINIYMTRLLCYHVHPQTPQVLRSSII